ncbi:MAG TPA: septal ring lytic transglycosylase RlpA family protein [Dongiaceae bacterium]|nr:septal ring lytic transglycosylase RlpA family protein [Dongiaceae bacterium]
MRTLKNLIIFLATFAILGCSTIQSKNPADWVGYTESGEASFYANKHQSRKTANGEKYSHDLKTAAHKTIPFGAKVKVTNVDNGKSVVVRINDRGPFVRGRIIDLSKSAFSSIGNTAQGLIDVEIEVVK